MLLSISGGSDLGLFEINEAAQLVAEAAHPEANIIFGAVIDDALGDEVRVTVIAAGFDGGAPERAATQPCRGAGAAGSRASSRPPRREPVDRAEPVARGRSAAERDGHAALGADPSRRRQPRAPVARRSSSTTATTSTSPTS